VARCVVSVISVDFGLRFDYTQPKIHTANNDSFQPFDCNSELLVIKCLTREVSILTLVCIVLQYGRQISIS
jgi:hypothetical protein